MTKLCLCICSDDIEIFTKWQPLCNLCFITEILNARIEYFNVYS